MKIVLVLLVVLTGTPVIIRLAQAQNQEGFISLDCGLIPSESPYTETQTGIRFISDADYIGSAGETRRITDERRTQYPRTYWTLRSFPEGTRNCYSLNVTKETNYLIKAGFLYGNYDDQNLYPSFDLYLGPNKWISVDEKGADDMIKEIIHMAQSDQLQICLVKTGPTVPFISKLVLRPLRNGSYVTETGSLMYRQRSYLSTSKSSIGYNYDVHDRNWDPFFDTKWTELSTTLAVNTSNFFEVY